MDTRRFYRPLFLAGALGVLAGCASDLTTLPGDDLPLEGEALVFETVNYSRLEESTDGGMVRVEIEILPNTLTAKEVEIESSDELADEEEIRSRATGLSVTGTTGSLTLELGDLVVTFDDATRFRIAGGEDITFDDFVAEIDAALAAGVHPAVKAERDPPATAQAPDDPAFHADELRLDTDLEQPEIELNVDRDNLIRNDAPPPDGWLQVLGIDIELRVTEGITEIEVERPEVEPIDFEGVVSGVDLDAGTFTLGDGTIVKMIDRTEMAESDEHAHRLRRLAAVKEAIDEGLTIIAFGKGVVESTDPLVLVALRVGFEVDESTLEEFEGVIESVDEDARSLTLEDGAIIRLIGLTHFGHTDDWHLTDDLLARVAEAIANGHTVATGGLGVVTVDDPLTIVALKIRFGIVRPPLEEFAGVIADVDLNANRFTLEDGTVIVLPRITDAANADGDVARFPQYDLQDVVDAMTLGLTVFAAGKGVVTAEDPITIRPARLHFKLQSDTAEEFAGEVTAADPTARTFTMADGEVITVLALTRLEFKLDGVAQALTTDEQPELDRFFDPLALIARALSAGLTVHAEGLIATLADGSLVALETGFAIELPVFEEFEDIIDTVDVTNGTFTLEDGTEVQWPYRAGGSSTESVSNLTPWPSIEGLAESVEAGLTVWAHGHGIVITESPLVIAALRVKFEVDDEDAVGFEGDVAAIDLMAKTVTLDDGTVIHVVALTAVRLDDDHYAMGILTRLASVLATHDVSVKGKGLHLSDSPDTFLGIALHFAVN